MKASVILLALATAVCATPPKSEEAKPKETTKKLSKPTPVPNPLAALARYRGKKGKPSNNVMSATRSGGLSSLRLVALAPGDEGLTLLEKPRLWWHQSAATRGGELEFVLSDLSSAQPGVMMRRPIPPMRAGFNYIDLSNPRANPDNLILKVGGTYQWTVNLRSEAKTFPVYCKLRRTEVDSPPEDSERLSWLSQSGNWYELFDEVSTKAKQDESTYAPIRSSLLDSAGLSKALRMPVSGESPSRNPTSDVGN